MTPHDDETLRLLREGRELAVALLTCHLQGDRQGEHATFQQAIADPDRALAAMGILTALAAEAIKSIAANAGREPETVLQDFAITIAQDEAR